MTQLMRRHSLLSGGFAYIIVLSCLFPVRCVSSFVSTGFSVSLTEGLDYFVSPYSSGNASLPDTSLVLPNTIQGHLPVTVVQGGYEIAELSSLFQNWTDIDDVFHEAFTQSSDLGINQSCSCASPFIVLPLNVTNIPSGPYFLNVLTNQLYPVYRLYTDFSGAFSQSLLQTPDGAFQPLSAQISGSADLTIGVPSRLYYTPDSAKPLAGVRIGIKNIIDLAGLRKSNSNRAWYHFYPAANKTAPAIQSLIDAGAVIVGYQKASQFANGESPTADWVDYHSPFNPRGDGYQSPSSSSSGAGASIASYDWLDMAVGSDTGGSVRLPSIAQGIFGNRPSHGIVSLEGVTPLAPALDTLGFLTRDPILWNTAAAVMYGSNYTSYASETYNTTTTTTLYPRKLYTSGFPTNASTPLNAILSAFAQNLSSLLSVPATPINLITAWSTTHSSNSTTNTSIPDSLPTLLNSTYITLISKAQTSLVRDPFYTAYALTNADRTPFIDPIPLSRWSYGDTLAQSTHTTALTNMSIFASWFNTVILPAATPDNTTNNNTDIDTDMDTCLSSGLLLYSSATTTPTPRNVYLAAPPLIPTGLFGFSTSRVAIFGGVPDVVVPVGEVEYPSTITGKVEVLPVTVNLIAARGCDGMVIGLVGELVRRGLVSVPRTGRSLVSGGDVLF